MSPQKAIMILKKLLGEAMALPGEASESPKRSQWTNTARGALEQAGVSSSVLESFDSYQAFIAYSGQTEQESREQMNSSLSGMTAVLQSAIAQLGWEIEEEEPATEPTNAVRPAVSKFGVNEAEKVVVNGEVWEGSSVRTGKHEFRIGRFSGDSVSKVWNLSFEDLSPNFDVVEIAIPGASKDLHDWEFSWLEIILSASLREGQVQLAYRVEYDLEFWAKQFSISDIATAIEKTLARHSTPFTYWQRDEHTCIEGFGVSMWISRKGSVQSALIEVSELKRLVPLIRAELVDRDTTAVNLVFDFPAPIKSACEQYLLYFVQFLSDLGIEANAELKTEASKVLFSVTPVDEKQALDQIREALRIYMGLPLAPDFAITASQFRDVAVSQLQANVLHLQSQIMLAKAAMEMKNATLEAKDAHIALLQDRIDLRNFQPKGQPEAADSDKEELVKDVLSVKKYDFKFLEINFPELLRKLKRRMG